MLGLVSRVACLALLPILGCSSSKNSEPIDPNPCSACVNDKDCGSSACAQFAGDSYCAPPCGDNKACAPDRTCTSVVASDGRQVDVCVPVTDVCGGVPPGGDGGADATSSSSTGSPGMCGVLGGPDVTACCTSCKASTPTKACQKNGCYGGWYCNTDSCKCQSPPSGDCGMSSTSSGSGGERGNAGAVTIQGGELDTLNFAVVGDTRPATIDDSAGYPTAIISKIWQDVEAYKPHPSFALTTGDYIFARPWGTQSAAQFDAYLSARKAFSNPVFFALGNHECTGKTDSNCGAGNPWGEPVNYKNFLAKLLGPDAKLPYYSVQIRSTSKAWDAKILVVAANAWTAAQGKWLEEQLAKSTTYTFVVRHEGSFVKNGPPGLAASTEILAKYPYTQLIVGHTHTFAHYAKSRELVVGNGGAPITGSVNYGYVIARQRADGAMVFRAYDYDTNALKKTLAVKADGTPAQ